jgi:O-antigen ligase
MNSSAPDKTLFYLFLVLILWLPLPLGSNRPWAWSMMEGGVFFLMASWCWLYYLGKVKLTRVFRQGSIVVFLFLCWLFYLVCQILPLPLHWVDILSSTSASIWQSINPDAQQIHLSVDPYMTVVGLLKGVAYFCFFFLVLVLVRERLRVRQLGYVLVISGLFQAVYGGLMTLSGLGYGFFVMSNNALSGKATGTFVNSNHLAGYLEMTLAVGIGLLIASLGSEGAYTLKQWVRNFFQLLLSAKARLRLCLVMMVIALVLTHSRMGNMAFFISLLVTGVIGLTLSRHATRSVVVLLISLVLIDIFIVGSWFGLEKVKQELEETSLMTESRDEVSLYTLEQWRDYELTGSGLGSFYSTFPYYRGNDIRGLHRETHNDYLQFATETGQIGMGLLVAIVSISLLAALIAQYRRRDPLMRGVSFAAIMGITAILIHSSVDFNLQIPANAATFCLLLALCWISLGLKERSGRP